MVCVLNKAIGLQVAQKRRTLQWLKHFNDGEVICVVRLGYLAFRVRHNTTRPAKLHFLRPLGLILAECLLVIWLDGVAALLSNDRHTCHELCDSRGYWAAIDEWRQQWRQIANWRWRQIRLRRHWRRIIESRDHRSANHVHVSLTTRSVTSSSASPFAQGRRRPTARGSHEAERTPSGSQWIKCQGTLSCEGPMPACPGKCEFSSKETEPNKISRCV